MTAEDRAGDRVQQRVALLTARDPLTAGDGTHPIRVARSLAEDGDQVVLALLEDAVALARDGHRHAGDLTAAIDAGVQVLAEEEALSRRAIDEPREGVARTALDAVVDRLFDWSDRQAWL